MKKRAHGSSIALRNEDTSDEFISSTLEPYGGSIPPGLAEKIRLYLKLLARWNEKINLTSILEPSEILKRHFGEALFAVHAVPISSGRLADVGSGAGFPALPIKLARPDLTVTLLEPNKRKAAFLAEVCRTLELSPVNIVTRRFEEFDAQEGSMHYVTCRAVGQVPRLLEWASGVLRPEGAVVLWVAKSDAQRIAATSDWRWASCGPLPGSRELVLLVGLRRGSTTA